MPICYHLFEVGESVIYGVLSMDMTGDKWNDDILPCIENTEYAKFLPKRGAGSRGGRVSTIRFLNGSTLRFATVAATLGRRGPTARVLIVTELNEWGRESESGKDPAKLSELEACTRAFGDRRILYGEGTTGTQDEPAWVFYQNSSQSVIHTQCPHCRKWSPMEREQLVGWDCDTESDARVNAHWVCPACGEVITEPERITSNNNAVLVHKGQSVSEEGIVIGPLPPTKTFGFRWSAYHNLFTNAGELGVDEWRAKNAINQEEAEKAIRQTVWCIPYVPSLLDDGQLNTNEIMKRVEKIGEGQIPLDTQFLTLGIDVGDWHCWYVLLAFRANQQIHIPAYGVFDVHSESLERKVAVLAALREFRDTVNAGWQMGDKQRVPDQVWIDAGHFPGIVHQFCSESGTFPSGRWMATIGRGQWQVTRMRYSAPKRVGNEIRRIGDGWFVSRSMEHRSYQVTIDADKSKATVQSGLKIPLYRIVDEETNKSEPNAGAITLYDPGTDRFAAKRHITLAKHYASERTVQRMVEGKGLVIEHEQHGANHFLDATAVALTAGSYLGYQIVRRSDLEQPMSVADWVRKRQGG